ncbi:uncharacterized protein LAJ45_10294 [Morchella importuna]|uniref:uncharacterized protein n=1 Tax=Morchella importuna TaxID=1174673 RepID=UPI001E8D4575|nr:uncharacterized protein LAJ45_10294 [Morchella importuna]KAH8145654.1 hypothetical protein LAJ45_10294 [Morchella importuna]
MTLACKTADLLALATHALTHVTSPNQHAQLSASERERALQQLTLTVQAAMRLADVAHVEALAAGGKGVEVESSKAEAQQAKREVERAILVATAKIKGETKKVEKEAKRAVAETGRLHAEALKIVNETDRAKAEAEKAGKEAERAVAETERLKAEAMMVRSEKMRIDAETERVKAETERVNIEAEKVGTGFNGSVHGGHRGSPEFEVEAARSGERKIEAGMETEQVKAAAGVEDEKLGREVERSVQVQEGGTTEGEPPEPRAFAGVVASDGEMSPAEMARVRRERRAAKWRKEMLGLYSHAPLTQKQSSRQWISLDI